MRIYLFIGVLLVAFTGCKSTDGTAKAEQALKTKNLVEKNDYEITFSWARPMLTNEMAQLTNANLMPMDSRSGQINLLGTANYIRKRGDSLEVYLPYYGTRQMGGRMGDTNGAIEFKGVPENYELIYNEKKGRTEVSFEMKEETELYQVYMTVIASQRANVSVNSSQRTPIRYSGKVNALKEEN